ncbi:MAG: hypothetical protein ACK4UN_06240, partial [Limisphaerales bacterium]
MLLNEKAQFDLAQRLRIKPVPISEVFTFLSGLYFRGKVAYARAFARPPAGVPGAFVITTDRGLIDLETPIGRKDLEAFSKVNINENEERYRRPLLREAKRWSQTIGQDCEVILLGSVATAKYVDTLLQVFGERLLFPSEF